MKRYLAAVAVAVCVLALPTLCLYIEYNTQYIQHGDVTPAFSYRIDNRLTLTDGAGDALVPVPSRTARGISVLLPAWGRLTAAMLSQLLDIAAALWDNLGTLAGP